MPKYIVGHKRRIPTGFTCDPDVLAEFDAKIPRGASRSAFIEALLDGFNKGQFVIQPAQPGAPVTP